MNTKGGLEPLRSTYVPRLAAILGAQHNIDNTDTDTMAIIHVVQFGFKPEVPKEQIDEVCRRVLALKDECIHPTTKKPYIKSFIGGIDKSEEGLQVSFFVVLYRIRLSNSRFQGGVTHVFVAEIESKEDLQYYLEKDPVHLAFSKSALPLIQTARVVDFEPGRFSKL
ncbi:hypothetical protein BKA80DRAFT_271963 [Phyllosticta citrichinensis]